MLEDTNAPSELHTVTAWLESWETMKKVMPRETTPAARVMRKTKAWVISLMVK